TVDAYHFWAVGYQGTAPNRMPVIYWGHDDTGSNDYVWTEVSSPGLDGDGFLNGINKYDADHIWAVGSFDNGNGYSMLTVYWNGSQWSQVLSPDPGLTYNELHSVWFGKEGDVWAAGE